MILVTGGAGFIGSALIHSLVNQGFEVRALDCFLKDSYDSTIKTNNWETISNLKNTDLVEFDLRANVPSDILDGVTTIVNLAAMPGLVQSWSKFELYNDCNTKAVFNLLQASIRSKVTKFIQVSTSSVYGNVVNGDESSALSPISPYGVTKLAGEELVRMFHRSQGIDYSILRYFSVYGPGQRPDMAYHRLINAILENRPFEVFGDGSQVRTNTYIDDCVEATILAIKSAPINDVVNVSGNDKITLREAISVMEKILNKSALIKHKVNLIGDQFETSTRIEKANLMFGYEPRWNYYDGISKQIEWHKSFHPN
jgi:nucleoside-diphosphate-sugar epimerase